MTLNQNEIENLVYVAFLAGILLILWLLRSPWLKGKSGEFWVKLSLRRNLDESGYQILNDLTLPIRGGTTQIDHVIVSRYGIFVVETKNLSGWIFGGANQKTWTQTFRRKKFKMQNPTHQNFKHVKAVQELLRIPQYKIHNVVAFVGSARPRTIMPSNVVWSIRELVRYINSFDQVLLNEDELSSISIQLSEGALSPSRKTHRSHLNHVKAQSGQLGASKAKCPRCGSEMVERTNRNSQNRFLGCSMYPKCKGTRRIG
ncbi:NERD domain-containing protein [Ruegeria arenilitoris]|uniref:nuclease-related domain-containing protein n=1 Tax=Ruegeria arenilitoris TaxID=1173585 RepID=UPI003C79CB41